MKLPTPPAKVAAGFTAAKISNTTEVVQKVQPPPVTNASNVAVAAKTAVVTGKVSTTATEYPKPAIATKVETKSVTKSLENVSLDGAMKEQDRVDRSKGFSLNVSKDDMVSAALVAADAVLELGQDMPMIGSVATLLRQLVSMYDGMRCSKEVFKKFKGRMERIYDLYFSEQGLANRYACLFTTAKQDNSRIELYLSTNKRSKAAGNQEGRKEHYRTFHEASTDSD